MPTSQVEEAVRADQVEQSRIGYRLMEGDECLNGIVRGTVRPGCVEVGGGEARVHTTGKLHHGETVFKGCGLPLGFQRLTAYWSEKNSVKVKDVCRRGGDRDVAVMRWIEAAAEEGYSHRTTSPTASALLGKVKDEAHAHLFDWVIMTVGTEGIEPAIAELGHTPVHNRKQLDIQSRQSFVLEVVVEDHLASGCRIGQAVVASAKSHRSLDVWLQRSYRSVKDRANATERRVDARSTVVEANIGASLRAQNAPSQIGA